MIEIGVTIQHMHSRYRSNRLLDGCHDFGTTGFGKVRNAFDERRGHKRSKGEGIEKTLQLYSRKAVFQKP
jgi:hypothetical protein